MEVSKELLEKIWDYLSEREDIKDGSDGRPQPNEAMSLLMDLKKEVGDLSPIEQLNQIAQNPPTSA